jgi:hypothetical protein
MCRSPLPRASITARNSQPSSVQTSPARRNPRFRPIRNMTKMTQGSLTRMASYAHPYLLFMPKTHHPVKDNEAVGLHSKAESVAVITRQELQPSVWLDLYSLHLLEYTTHGFRIHLFFEASGFTLPLTQPVYGTAAGRQCPADIVHISSSTVQFI